MATNQDNQSATRSPVVWGILMLICGILAVAVPLVSSIGIVILVGWLILFVGVFHLIFAFHTRRIGGVLWQLLLAVVYGFAGIYMLVHPLLGLVSLTLVLAIFLLFEAVLEIVLFFAIRHVKHAGWVLFNGIVTLALGGFIWAQWPSSSSWVLGTLIGISLIFSGLSRLMLSASMRRPGQAHAGPAV
jgi:uncharacterized membrane protein HdeD (DUF308 family)